MRTASVSIALSSLALLLGACGARSGLSLGDAGARPDGRVPMDARIDASEEPDDGGRDASRDTGLDAPSDGGVDATFDAGCMPLPDGCGMTEICSNGLDDDCDGEPDDGCACEAGSVQSCFPGPPGRRGVGACTDGEQVCGMGGTWGACLGGIGPSPDICNGLDNLCDGCSAQRDCPIDCPGPDDPRITDGAPFAPYELSGGEFYPGIARSFRWTISGGPCDTLAPRLVSFDLEGANRQDAVFTPRLSGDYTVRLDVVTAEGTPLSCEWVVHVRGPGLRIEMCYPESETQDLDLFLHQPNDTTPWYPRGGDAFDITDRACSWANCEAVIRGAGRMRADWGYMPSDLSECDGGPQGPQWTMLGFCANPRLDIDNNLSEGTGLPENINVDAPGDGETFRVMVENFTGTPARPVVNVYCDGRRIATYGASPDELEGFRGTRGDRGVGAMWRVVDVTTRRDATGALSCDLAPLHPPGTGEGYWITNDDPRY